jgi:hypothetical protein
MKMTDRERLEELKEWFNNDKEIHEFQIEWLIAQAEKVEELKQENQWLYSKLNMISEVIEKGREESQKF